MARGNEPLVSLLWQPVPGIAGTTLFPVIRKADVISSNSYLVRMPDFLLLIDPGGLPEQAELLFSEITRCRAEQALPLVVLLTHAHVDHFIGISEFPALADPAYCILAAHDTGASAIEQHDTGLTQAAVLGREFAGMSVGIHLFLPCTAPGCPGREHLHRDIPLPHAGTVSCVRDRSGPASGSGPDREFIGSGPGCRIELYHTPGHSPDSICIKIGRVLFIGDVLFAANPGIAGLHGWNQDDLIRSLDKILVVLDEGTVDIVCPGHGKIFTAAAARTILESVRDDAVALTNIVELNGQRAEETAAFAEDCMEEINELFTIMAGRLFYVAHVMEELGETDMAARADTLIDGDVLDGLLESFREFADAHHAKNHVSIHLALKAGQVIGKLDRSFQKDELSRIIDVSLVNRAGRLLSSYTAMLRGFALPRDREPCDLCTVVESVVIGLSGPSSTDDDILAATDDEAAFSRLLLARIGNRPLLDDVKVSIRRGGIEPDVLIDRDLFTDLVTYILEDLVGTGAEELGIEISTDAEHATITITGTGKELSRDHSEKIRGFFLRLCERAGGLLTGGVVPDGRRYAITVNRATG